MCARALRPGRPRSTPRYNPSLLPLLACLLLLLTLPPHGPVATHRAPRAISDDLRAPAPRPQLINFRTAVVVDQGHKRVMYTGSRTIAVHYARTWLLLDIVSTLPWDLFGPDSRGLELLRMLKLARLAKLLNNLHVTEQLFRAFDVRMGTQSYTKIIVRFFGIIIVFAHIFACYWFAVGTIYDGTEAGGETSWVAYFGYADEYVSTQYMASVYTIIMTFSTVGFGDIRAVNEYEQAFACCAMVVGAGIFTYGITCVVTALNTSNPVSLELDRRMDLLNVYMRNTKLPPDLKQKMRKYIYQLADCYFVFKEKELIADLSPGLQSQVTLLTNFALIKRVPFFRDADERCVRDIISVLHMGLYVPEEVIITEGDMGDEMYFIKKGQCQIFIARTGVVIATVKDGNYFGETAIIMSQRRGASVKSLGYSVVFVLKAADLRVIIKQHDTVRASLMKAVEERMKSMQDAGIDKKKIAIAGGGAAARRKMNEMKKQSTVGKFVSCGDKRRAAHWPLHCTA